ncbi:hypothetical protein [Chromohalobacter canadensis]|uniref:hypothetical protein n=1 Tax=Chromohalobacter canadensis TaxID=141389 RepID=UPI00241009A0|nr:hypothetical protein [Chromohalobacter canadensis]
MFLRLSDGRIVGLQAILSENGSTSLPRNPGNETLTLLGYARIQPTPRPDGDVVTQGKPEQRDDGKWYQTWDVREFTPEERAERLEQAKAEALRDLNAAYTATVQPLVRSYPETEQQTWLAQEDEAQAYQAWIDGGRTGDAPATPKLDRILAGRNGADGTETIEELVGKVLRNAEAFAQALDLMGVRHRSERLINAAETVDDVRAVTWESLTTPD